MKNYFNKEERKYRIAKLKEAINARQLLESLGFEIYRETPTEVRGPCKVHGGDNKTAFRMNKLTKNWVCFSHGCHETIGYDVISLIEHMLNLSFSEALKYLETITGIDIDDPNLYVKYVDEQDKNEFIKETLNNQYMPPALVSEEYLKSFRRFRSPYFEQEEHGGFPPDVLDFFEVGGGYVDKYGFQRDVIPIRDDLGKLVAYSCRDITNKADEDYKYILTEGFKKNNVLYNLHNAKNYLGENRSLVIVEGFKSVWKLFMANYKNAVACMGSRITEGQQALLYKYVNKVYIFFDADLAGVKGTVKAIEDLKNKIDVHPIFLPYTGCDPADLDLAEIKTLLGGI